MATTKRTIPKRHPFYAALEALGCTFCPRCYAYMYPDHVAHVTAFDRHTRETFPPAPVTLTAEPLTSPAAA
jgi:hypothetical protein